MLTSYVGIKYQKIQTHIQEMTLHLVKRSKKTGFSLKIKIYTKESNIGELKIVDK